uniref:UvrD-like helicase ATP-binding domain-containing protein n=2 Tax=Lactuca sativa TaxID=4236 RepID=A0A9R1UN48_LACSA|nr:hypothetical protein LSAT_V11C800402640 [Lactuca sativa]
MRLIQVMMEGSYLGKEKEDDQRRDDFTQTIFSWSLDDILNEDLYKYQVEKIPLTFSSKEQYFGSFIYPLLEETRADLASSMEIMYRAPFAEVFSFSEVKHKGKKEVVYDVTVDTWKNRFSERGKEPYRTLPGDLLILAEWKPEFGSDLHQTGRTWAFALVKTIEDDEDSNTSVRFKVKTLHQIECQDGLYVVFLMNITTNKRIWNSLHMNRNSNIIKEILYSDNMVKENCDSCSSGLILFETLDLSLVSKLNESQQEAIMASIGKIGCSHNSSVEQIWGPPGTGKTMTVSVMLSIFLQMKCRTLTCAPTNVAVVQVASRVLSLVKESFKTRIANGDCFYSIGDLLLFGNKERLKVGNEIEEIYLENRIKRLTECLGSLTGWKHCLRTMIDLLEDCVSQYCVYVDNEKFKEEQLRKENENENGSEISNVEVKSFVEFLQDRFSSSVFPLRTCIITFCTHISRSFLTEETFQNMVFLLNILCSLESLLFQDNLDSDELENLFSSKPMEDDFEKLWDIDIQSIRSMSISIMKTLQRSLEKLRLPNILNKYAMMDFCFQGASLIFCTTSSSYKLHTVEMKPLNFLVIDEAAQLKEAESTIPLQLHGIKHAVLIGDECQLPAMVTSNVSAESGFGRSLFDRLSSLRHSKHLLNVQYRMHPSISLFPNLTFYQNQILDAENVTCKSYEKKYLSGPMFGPYSFINVVGGREETDDDGRSRRNLVEVAVVIKIVQSLYKACYESKKKLSIGVVSPYAAQVVSIQEKLAHKYEKVDGFSVKVKSIDGFQGGEEDIIILSTVRSNTRGSVGFIDSPQRTNVALTRARHCLWILGNERTLVNSESVWEDIVKDARNRECLFDADADELLRMTIISAKKELEQLDDLVNGKSVLFRHAKWKVLFSDGFRRSFAKLKHARLKKVVLNLLLKLSGGWRPKNRSVDLCCERSSQIMKQFKVEGLYVICTVDIIKEVKYIQVLKIWDLLPFDEISKLTKRLENIFAAYTDEYISHCTAKSLEGDLEVPRIWAATPEIIRFRNLNSCEDESDLSTNGDGRSYVENSKVSESLLLMKFYSLSSGVVNHLLSGKDIDLPMQVTDEQMDIILFRKSSFIIGRSGTGKTTILTMKLYQNEQSFRFASKGFDEAESSGVKDVESDDDHEKENKPIVLRQLFVTVSPRLCYAVKHHVSHLTSISSDGNSSGEINLDDVDVAVDSNVPETFVEVPEKSYPLVMTFEKFLMMLDSTLGNSFFERFPEAREGSHGNHISSRSIALQTFIRSRNVTFDKFHLLYWPHFNSNLKKKLDASRVFTEIISHIKGGLHAGASCNGKLSYEDYSLLSEVRASTLTKQKREDIYTLFQAYEKMKTERGEFDWGDLVNDLHHRLKSRRYEGDQMDFVYIDEVQDLSMRQISLFKYICQNVEEGFIFAGDTAQTIARGIDFRFEDIRSLFYTEFLSSGKQEKGQVSEKFQLKQNFRTHAGVLELAQSVIEILYHYFAHSIDLLEPETSLISGEAPVLLESGNDENAIVTIFGGTGSSGEIIGFGAEQVILVRDDSAKTEICEYVGKQALVLTIVECKGLEFQDVLLYNFFGTSPLKDRWRVIYGYMNDQDLLDGKLFPSFPTFKESKHNVLCSELKQLYVAITRTRQRLWICENKEELSKPMFHYWKRKGLVQVRKLDDSVAQAMRVASSPQEWRERGKKLYYENNFVMATMCFERAGDTIWEKLAKASGLRAMADQMQGTNPGSYFDHLREAAEMFESIGKLESAASCYCDLREYERAGKIYLEKCGKINEAAECFLLAGCYSDAAEAYSKGDQFANCLSACKKGELFDKGMQYIEYWKEHVIVRSKEIEKIEQEFLESCALDYHERKDSKSMMKFVRCFCSMESKRVFLKSKGCFDELLLLEEESGCFLEAAELVRSWGDVLKEADLLGKAGSFKDAASLIIWYVFFNSLWGNGSSGWPLKKFAQKEELCERAKSLAKSDSDIFYGFVCRELKLLSDQQSNLSELKRNLQSSQQNNCLRGEILCNRKILEAHLCLNSSKYDWEDELPVDINKHCDEKILQNQVSVRTLVFCWDLWKENIMDIFETLESFENAEADENNEHVDFVLNYFGVRKQSVKGNTLYLLVNKDASWVRNSGNKGVFKDGKRVNIGSKQLVVAIQSYWQVELLSVGIKVLQTLEALYKLKTNGSSFHQSSCLLNIFKVSKFLLDSSYLKLTHHHTKTLEQFLRISTSYFDIVFPLDWRKSISRELISLRETYLSLNLLEDIILQNLHRKSELSYSTIGIMMMICFGSRKPVTLYKKIITGLQWNPTWKSFVQEFLSNNPVVSGSYSRFILNDAYFAPQLQDALEDVYRANWRSHGYISPHSFVYLLDYLLFMTSFSQGMFFTTRSSFLAWLPTLGSTSTQSITLSASQQMFPQQTVVFFVGTIQDILYNKVDTGAWIRSCDVNPAYYHPLLVLKLVMMLCLICLKVSDCSEVLLNLLLGRNNIAYLLPQKFVSIILRRRKGRYLNLNPDVVAEAFISINDPLLAVVSAEDVSRKIHVPFAIFVDLRTSKEEIMNVLFPRKSIQISQPSSKNVGVGTILEEKKSSNMLTTAAKLNLKSLNWKNLEEISESLKQKKGEVLNFSSVVIKKELDKDIHTLATVLEDAKSNAGEDTIGKVTGALGELKVLSCAFDTSEHKEKHGVFTNEAMKTLQLVVEHLQGNRPLIDDFLNKTQDSKVVQKVVSESSNTSEVHQEEDDATDSQVDMVEEEQSNDGNTQDSKTKKGKGKKKAKNSNVDSMVDSVVEKQSTSGNNQDPKNKKGKGNNKGKNKGKKGKGKNK